MNAIFIHIGTELPECLFDSLYQTLLINEYKSKIYVIIDDTTIDTFNSKVSEFSFNHYTKTKFDYLNIINVVPLSILEMNASNDVTFNNYKQVVTQKFQNLSGFRSGFWISTTARFFYIAILMRMFNIKRAFHIENDIMMYDNFSSLYDYICKINNVSFVDKICMVQDSPNRVIPSLLFFPDSNSVDILTQYITNELCNSESFLNDMSILGSFVDKIQLPVIPQGGKIIFDGAALGQYLGGVDYRNLPNADDPIVCYNNPSRGFLNETAIIRANEYNFSKSKVILDHLRVPVRVPILYERNSNRNRNKITQIANLHIHSKQLYQFSSACDIQFDDIISGDRILSLCDFVLLTKPILEFHKNIEKYAKDVIGIRDINNVNMVLLNSFFKDHCEKNNTKVVRLFIYTHMLDGFQKFIFPRLDSSIHYDLYLHNSDHAFTDKYSDILHSDYIRKIYAQNLDITFNSNKLTLLPIGIANSMWKHGDILEVYKTISQVYRKNKVKSIYVNINPSTYFYRKNILDKINEKGQLKVSTNKPYAEYLRELAEHRFCLCIRGNGIDTHRFWESLYLGVIPVIINNKTTQSNNFVKYLRYLDVPFYEIKEDDLDTMFNKYTQDFFNDVLYSEINTNSSIFNTESLKLNFYK
jgi:hypothetical protein